MSIGNGVVGLRKHAFSGLFLCCQVRSGLTGRGGGQTAQDNLVLSVFGAGGPTGQAGGRTGQMIFVSFALGQK